MTPRTEPISVVILAKDEEEFIGRCITSVRWADEILVLDSGSQDGTVEIAKSLGARVCTREWLGRVERQRALGVSLASHDWVLCLDSDEIVTPRLARSLMQVSAARMDPHDGYSVDRRGDFLGALLPNGQRRSRRTKAVRLFNREYSGWSDAAPIHEEAYVPGRRIPLEGVLIHWRGYTMRDYATVFARYASLEADQLAQRGAKAGWWSIIGRPGGRFLWCYLRKGGFRLGTRGLVHAMLKAFAEFLRYAELWELEHAPRQVDPSAEIRARFDLPETPSPSLAPGART